MISNGQQLRGAVAASATVLNVLPVMGRHSSRLTRVRGNNRTRTNGASTYTDACLREAAAADIVLLYAGAAPVRRGPGGRRRAAGGVQNLLGRATPLAIATAAPVRSVGAPVAPAL